MFVRSANPVWSFVDLTGLPLNDGYYAFFLSNVFPYVTQNVFNDPNGIFPVSDPLQFLPNGTLQNNLYFNPNLVYRIEIRQGPTQADPLIYLIENYVPGSGSSSSTTTALATTNQIINPQFYTVDFVSPLTITSAGTYDVAPGWSLVLTGAGTAVVSRIINVPPQNQINNPTYALDINTTGSWATVQLIQTFTGNSALWSSTTNPSGTKQDGFVSMSLTAMALGSPYPISMAYSNGLTTVYSPSVISGTIGLAQYQALNGTILVGVPSAGSSNAVQMIVNLQPIGHIQISNLQLIGQTQAHTSPTIYPGTPLFQQETIERQISNEFSYYFNSIQTQPKDSILVGWEFGLNPWQFWPVGGQNVANNTYTADQTIVVQQNYVAAAVGNNILVGQAGPTQNYGFVARAVTAHNQFAIIQYIDPATVGPYWQKTMSSLVTASLKTTHATAGLTIKMRLIYNASLPPTVSQTDPISSWAENGDPVFNAGSGWVALKPINDPAYTLTATPTQFAFNGFVLPTSGNATATVGVVLYTTVNMNQTATADFIVIDDVSLVNNQFGLPSNPKTWNQVLEECQYYYEKSYDTATALGTASTNAGQVTVPQVCVWDGASAYDSFPTVWAWPLRTVKRAAPTMTFYNPSSGASNSAHAAVWHNGSTENAAADVTFSSVWQQTALVNSTKVLSYSIKTGTHFVKSTALAITDSCWATASFHYVADSRLGI